MLLPFCLVTKMLPALRPIDTRFAKSQDSTSHILFQVLWGEWSIFEALTRGVQNKDSVSIFPLFD